MNLAMLDFLILIGATALTTALATIGIAYVLFRAYLKSEIYRVMNAELDAATDVMKEKLREGAFEAGRELMPEFREEVREGFKEALAGALGGDIIEQTARNLSKNSQGIVEQGLGLLLGRPVPREPDRR